MRQFSGTRLGSQELFAQILREKEGALWTRTLIRYESIPQEQWKRIVIAIDPAMTNHNKSDETGIIIAAQLSDQRAIVLEDLSGRMSPSAWGKRVVESFFSFQADRVVAEVNNGGDLVQKIIHSIEPRIPYKAVRATRGKWTRAEPISALYEQKKVVHLKPFPQLEEQMCSFTPEEKESPDRLDALVWALHELFFESISSCSTPQIWGGV
jgi:predicted phage terminase large subunit-like protein